MPRISIYCVIAATISLATALPNPAINRVDGPGPITHVHGIHTTTASTIASSSASASPASDACIPLITLQVRNPAVDGVDAVGARSVSVAQPSQSPCAILGPAALLEAAEQLHVRDPAIGYLIDVANNLIQEPVSVSVSVSSSASLVSDACTPYITLEARSPAVNRVDAVGAHPVMASTPAKPPCAILDGSTPFIAAEEHLAPRND